MMMKTRILKLMVVAVFAIIPMVVNAQVQFNLKQGMVVSTLSNFGDLGDNNHPSLSFTAGAFAVIPLSQYVSFQPELNYIRKGRYEKNTMTGISSKFSQASDYLQLPLLVRLTPNDLLGDSKAKFFFTTGLYESLLLHSEQTVKTGNTSTGTDITSNIKKNDLGFILGGGVQFPFRSKMLQVEVRYDMGLTKISDQIDYHTKALSLTLGMTL
jgi:hypothetical protein